MTTKPSELCGLWLNQPTDQGLEVRLSMRWREEASEKQRKQSRAKKPRARVQRSRPFEECAGGKLFIPGVLPQHAGLVEEELDRAAIRIRQRIREGQATEARNDLARRAGLAPEPTIGDVLPALTGPAPSGRPSASAVAVAPPRPRDDDPPTLAEVADEVKAKKPEEVLEEAAKAPPIKAPLSKEEAEAAAAKALAGKVSSREAKRRETRAAVQAELAKSAGSTPQTRD